MFRTSINIVDGFQAAVNKFCERAFSHAAAWNALLEDLRAVVDPVKFRVEGDYFTLAFNVLQTYDFLSSSFLFKRFMDCCNATMFILI